MSTTNTVDSIEQYYPEDIDYIEHGIELCEECSFCPECAALDSFTTTPYNSSRYSGSIVRLSGVQLEPISRPVSSMTSISEIEEGDIITNTDNATKTNSITNTNTINNANSHYLKNSSSTDTHNTNHHNRLRSLSSASYYTTTSRPVSSVRPNSVLNHHTRALPHRPISMYHNSNNNNNNADVTNTSNTTATRPVSLLSIADSLFGTNLSDQSRPNSGQHAARRRRRPVSMQIAHPISRYYPIFTISIVVAMWLSYILGIVLSDDLSLSSLGMYQPVSPPNWQWWFFTVAPFPACSDERFKAWRLVSMQLVHSGLWHIGGNSIAILIFGSILEMYHPLSFVSTLCIFEASVTAGVLGYSALSPYDGLVGASPGAYGLLGACWHVALCHRDLLDPVVTCVLPLVLLAQCLLDVVFFFLAHNADTAYSSHAVGLATGFAVSLALTMTYRKISWTACIHSVVGILLYSAIAGFFTWHYLVHFPPEPIVSRYLYNLDTRSRCCHQFFEKQARFPAWSKERVVNSISCDY